MIAGARWMDAIFSKKDLWFFLERIGGIDSEKVDEFYMFRMSSPPEDVSLSEGAASEIAPEPSRKERS